MLVGGAGCGKTVLVNDKLNSIREETLITTIPFNHYTTSLMLQGVMEKPLEKKAGTQSVSLRVGCSMKLSLYVHFILHTKHDDSLCEGTV